MRNIRERRADHGTVKWYVADSGTTYTHYDCMSRLRASVRAMHRWTARSIRTMTEWDDADMRESDISALRWELGEISAYVEHVQGELDRIEGVSRTRERVKALREVAGRTPEEAALYLRKADELERGAA